MNNIWEQLKEYILQLIDEIPQLVYEGTASVLCLGIVVLIAWKGWRKGLRYSAAMALMCYVFLLYCSTLFFRVAKDVREYNFHPFWSYKAIEEGRTELLPENIMNVVAFVPVGMILGSLLRVKGSWLIALMVGMGISVSIEAMQYFLKRGFSEVDDVIHNTFGCILGYGVFLVIKGLWRA